MLMNPIGPLRRILSMPLISRSLSLCASVLLSASLYAQSSVQVLEEDGLLTVRASDVTAIELAEELSQQLGISIVITGDAETRINLDIVKEPVERALARLSPNNLLVRSEDDASEIIEVVLMMGEGQNTSGGGDANEFLPTGSPAEELTEVQSEEAYDPNTLRDPNRAGMVRDAAAAASSDANLPAEQVPPMFAEDVGNEATIDPATGLPYEQ